MNEPILVQIDTSGLRDKGRHETINQLWGLEVKYQGHTRPKIEFEDLEEASFSGPLAE